MSSPPVEEPVQVKRRVVFVVGSGGSGTGLMARSLHALGMHVPQPPTPAAPAGDPVADPVADPVGDPVGDPAAGSGRSQWVVDFHEELLARCNVEVSDSRPDAWFEAGKQSHFEPLRQRLHAWLEPQFVSGGPELVVEDPRLAWFVGLWRSATLRCDASPAYVTMLRPVTQVVGPVRHPATGAPESEQIQRTAAWVNQMLHTERATRGSQRAFVRHAELLADWTQPLFAIGRHFELESVGTASANRVRAVHALIDADRPREDLTWDGVAVPGWLRDLAEETWRALDRVAGDDTPEVHDTLDQLRASYAGRYGEAEAVARSTTMAAFRDGLRRLPAPDEIRPGPGRLSDRVPHAVRAAVPKGARRRLRRTFGRERG